jgi:hypothetical protein
MEEAFNANS